MSEPLTPEKLAAQQEAMTGLRKLRAEHESFHRRRDRAIRAAKATGLSLRDIGREIGLSAQMVLNIAKKHEDAEPEIAEPEESGEITISRLPADLENN